MVRNTLFLHEWDRGVARIDTVARVLDLRDGGVLAGVNHFDPGHFFIGLAGFLQELFLAGEHLVFIQIAQRTNDFVFSAGGVSRPVHVDHVAANKLGRSRGLQATRDKVRIGQRLLADEPGAIQVRIRRSLNPLRGKAVAGRCSAFRPAFDLGRHIRRVLRPRRRRH